MRFLASFFVCAALGVLFHAKGVRAESPASGVTFDSFLQEGMVFQNNQSINVAGSATSDGNVTVTLGTSTLQTSASGGRWKVQFAPMAYQTGLVLKATGSNAVQVKDIAIGDVFLCAGQSNMDLSNINSLEKSPTDGATVFTDRIRFMKMPAAATEVPQTSTPGKWFKPLVKWKSGASSADIQKFDTFSAVCTHFAAQLARKVGGITMGFVQTSYGGATIESFIPNPSSLDGTVLNASTGLTYEQHRLDTLDAPDPQLRGNYVFNGMVNPLRNQKFRAVVWYQGEANAVSNTVSLYRNLFLGMVQDYKNLFGSALSFFVVQLPSIEGRDWKAMHLVQSQLIDYAKKIYVVPSYEVVPMKFDPNGVAVVSTSEIHPIKKKYIGERVGSLVSKQVYGLTNIVAPAIADNVFIYGNFVMVIFREPDKSHPKADMVDRVTIQKRGANAMPGAPIVGVELLHSGSSTWVPATAFIGTSLTFLQVRIGSSATPVKIRYGYGSYLVSHDLNQTNGSPILPFQATILPERP